MVPIISYFFLTKLIFPTDSARNCFLDGETVFLMDLLYTYNVEVC